MTRIRYRIGPPPPLMLAVLNGESGPATEQSSLPRPCTGGHTGALLKWAGKRKLPEPEGSSGLRGRTLGTDPLEVEVHDPHLSHFFVRTNVARRRTTQL